MKLIRFGDVGREKPGIALNGSLYDCSAFGEDYNEAFFESGGMERLKAFVEKTRIAFLPLLQGSGWEARWPVLPRLSV